MNSTTAATAPILDPTRTSPRVTLLLTCMGAFLVSLDATMMFAMFGNLRLSFPLQDAADLSWILNAYTVVYAAFLIPAGGLCERYGSKMMFLWGIAIFAGVSIVAAMAVDPWWLVGARIFQALGAAVLTPASLALLLREFPAENRPKAISLWGATGALAAACGPALGALVTDTLGWRYALVLNVPVSIAVFTLGWFQLKTTPRRLDSGKLDFVGIVILILAVTLLTFSLVQLRKPDWPLSELLWMDAIAAGLLVVFTIWIRSTKAPLIKPTLFQHRHYNIANMATLSFGIAFSIMFFSAFFYLTQVWGYSLSRAGLAIVPGPLIVIPTAIIAGSYVRKYGAKPVLTLGAVVYACSGLWYGLMLDSEARYLVHWLPGSMLSGMGVGMVLPTLVTVATQKLPEDAYAVGSAVNQAIRQVGSVFGVALTVLVLGHQGIEWQEFKPLYLGYAGLAVVTAMLAMCLPNPQKG